MSSTPGWALPLTLSKPDFIGKAAVEERKATGPERRMVQFLLQDPEPLLYHNEPLLRDGEIVGHLTSGAYGHTLGGAVGMGYVPCKGESAAQVLASTYEVDVMGTRVPATASLKPL